MLAIDSSGSIDDDEWVQQMTGYQHAFENERFQRMLVAGGGTSLVAFAWSANDAQKDIVSCLTIRSPADSLRAAAAFKSFARSSRGGTHTVAAIEYGERRGLACNPAATVRVLDISTDGTADDSSEIVGAQHLQQGWLHRVRDRLADDGWRINTLPIENEISINSTDRKRWPTLADYMRENVQAGVFSFTMSAQSFDDFEAIILRKLVREVSDARSTRITQR